MGLGPKLEQIDWAEPTFRVEATGNGTHWVTVAGAELLTGEEAIARARDVFRRVPGAYRVRVVNERTGFTRDELTRESHPAHRGERPSGFDHETDLIIDEDWP